MSESTSDFDSSSTLRILFIIFIISVSVLVTVGNSIVILAMIVQKSLRTPPNLYLGSLALIDLSVGIFILPLRIIQVINHGEWEFGPLLCGIYVIGDITLCTLSIYHLLAIALDRYRAITQGIRYVKRRSFLTVTITICFLWVVALWVSTPPSLGWHNDDWGYIIDKENNHKLCLMTRNKGYVFHSVLGSFLLPIVIITILYYRIYVGIKAKLRQRVRPASMMVGGRQNNMLDFKSTGETSDTFSSQDILEKNEGKSETLSKRIQFNFTKLRRSILQKADTSTSQLQTPTSDTVEGDDTTNSPPSSNTLPSKSILLRHKQQPTNTRPASQLDEFVRKKIKFSLTKERRAARTLGIILGAFLICWLPFCIMYIIDAFFYPLGDSVWFEIGSWLGYVNSSINPFIYTYMFNREYKRAFAKVLFCYKK